MKIKKQISSPLITGSLLLLAVFLVPLIYIGPADIIKITVIELCRIHPVYSYLITGLFIVFGTDSIISGWKHFEGFAFQRFMVLLFGCTFIVGTLFNQLSQYEVIAAWMSVRTIHRCFASISLISFAVLTISAAFSIPDETGRKLSYLTGFTVLLTAILQAESENYTGLWQRFVILIISGWIIGITRCRYLKQ